MQLPIVALLCLVSFQIARAFGKTQFQLVSLGWFFNLAYLLGRRYLVPYEDALPIDVPRLLVFASSTAFWLAARRSGYYLLALPTWLFFALACINWGWVEIASHPRPTLWTTIPDALFDAVALLFLSRYLYHFMEQSGTRYSFARLLPTGTLLYAAVQFLQVPPQPVSSTSWVMVLGFSLGLVCKSLILVGMVSVLADALACERERRAQVVEAGTTAKRLAHELNTPASEIVSYVLTLRDSRDTETLNKIRDAAERLTAILAAARDVFDVGLNPMPGRAETEQATPAPVSINRLCERAIMAVKETRDEAPTYSVHYSAGARIRVVDTEIVQVLINLLRNAYDALPDGVGRISITSSNVTSPDSDGGSRERVVQLAIQDNGHGVAPELLPDVFKDGVSTREGVGRGYGLGIARRYVEKYGGTIRIENVSRDGSMKAGGCRVVLGFQESRNELEKRHDECCC